MTMRRGYDNKAWRPSVETLPLFNPFENPVARLGEHHPFLPAAEPTSERNGTMLATPTTDEFATANGHWHASGTNERAD